MENSRGIMPIGSYGNRLFGGYEDLAVEMVASERGSRYYEDSRIPDEVYEYARYTGREIENREDLDEVYEELRLRR